MNPLKDLSYKYLSIAISELRGVRLLFRRRRREEKAKCAIVEETPEQIQEGKEGYGGVTHIPKQKKGVDYT